MANKKKYPPEGFAEKLRETMYKRRISGIKLAELLDRERKIIYAWTSGEICPSLTDAMKMSVILDVSLEWLCGLKEKENV